MTNITLMSTSSFYSGTQIGCINVLCRWHFDTKQ